MVVDDAGLPLALGLAVLLTTFVVLLLRTIYERSLDGQISQASKQSMDSIQQRLVLLFGNRWPLTVLVVILVFYLILEISQGQIQDQADSSKTTEAVAALVAIFAFLGSLVAAYVSYTESDLYSSLQNNFQRDKADAQASKIQKRGLFIWGIGSLVVVLAIAVYAKKRHLY